MEKFWILCSIFLLMMNQRSVQQNLSDTCGVILEDFSHALSSDAPMFAPWAVSIGSGYPNHSHFCTGSIIKDNVVATAAHCLTHRKFDRKVFHC